MSESKPKVLIFGSMGAPVGHSSWAKLTIGAANQAGWQPLPFNDLDFAIDELNPDIDALVTRTMQSFWGSGPDTSTLIQRSDELGIPKAVVATHSEAHGNEVMSLIRKDSPDIFITDVYPELVSRNIGIWLVDLAQRSPARSDI